MPIITPAYPSMCATHNVTRSTLEVITNEFARASEITEKIMKGKLPWSALFVKHDFFLRYKYYLAITAASKSAETQVKWLISFSICTDQPRQGFVESKIRQLLMRIEMVDGIVLAHPFNTSFDKIHYCTTDEEAAQVATGEVIRHLRAESTDLQKTFLVADGENGAVEQNEHHDQSKSAIIIYTSTFYIGLDISLKDCKFVDGM
jgi:poly(A) polymerase